jgi:hypothetical protein
LPVRSQQRPRGLVGFSHCHHARESSSGAQAALTVDQDGTATDLHPYRVAGHYDVRIAIGILVQRCRYLYRPAGRHSDEGVLWFLDPWSRSWASLHHVPDVAAASYQVRQFGPGTPWTEVETAYRQWVAAGEPAVDR